MTDSESYVILDECFTPCANTKVLSTLNEFIYYNEEEEVCIMKNYAI